MSLAWFPDTPLPLSASEVALGVFALACLLFAAVSLIRFCRACPRPRKESQE
jgi:hypothetical protein